MTLLGLSGATAAAVMAVAGLPPVDLDGVLHHFGVMDPLCGGTRAARLAARGRWAAAWQYNPAGIAADVAAAVAVLLGRWAAAWQYNPAGIAADVAAAVAVLRAAVGYVAGRWLDVFLAWTPRRRRVAVMAAVVLVAVLQVRQQLRADLLIQHH